MVVEGYVFCFQPHDLNEYQKYAEANGQKRPCYVEHGRKGELKPGKHDRIIHYIHSGAPPR
jgi:hypothetical protein